NAGMDPTQAQAWAASTELTIAAQKAFVVSTNNAIAALQTSVSTLNSQLGIVNVQIGPASRRSAIGYTISVAGVDLTGASQATPIGSFPDGIPLVSGGSFFDYSISVPTGGQYSFSVGLLGSSGTTLAFHAEDPVGTATPSVSWPGIGPGWTNVTGPTLTLAPGPQVIRFVVDSAGGVFHLQRLYLTRQS